MTIDEFFHKDNDNDDNTKSKRLKDDKHELTSASIDNICKSFRAFLDAINALHPRALSRIYNAH